MISDGSGPGTKVINNPIVVSVTELLACNCTADCPQRICTWDHEIVAVAGGAAQLDAVCHWLVALLPSIQADHQLCVLEMLSTIPPQTAPLSVYTCFESFCAVANTAPPSVQVPWEALTELRGFQQLTELIEFNQNPEVLQRASTFLAKLPLRHHSCPFVGWQCLVLILFSPCEH